MTCPHCKGSGLDQVTDRCIPPNYYNCRYCGGSGLLKDVLLRHLEDFTTAVVNGSERAILESEFDNLVDVMIEETISDLIK
jgi:DnaJ-class molecular chaperone